MLIAPRPIQYADDTVIVTEAHLLTLRVIARILCIYENLAGLQINRRKSSFVPIAVPVHLTGTIQSILGCHPARLPITYLGIPLTCKRLNIADFQQMVNSVRSRMSSWSSGMLSYGGRVTLVKAVLTVLPLHYMQALKLPKGVINQIDRVRRSFLWRGNETCRGINCLVNWPTVCALKKNGGMGILDLEVQNDALLTKWLWKIDRDLGGLWAHTLATLYDITAASQLQENPNLLGFVRSLCTLLPFYRISVMPDDTLPIVHWKWTTHGNFTTSSAYVMMHDRGERYPQNKVIWKLKVPHKVKIFIWILCRDSLLTQEALTIRGCVVPYGCHLCQNAGMETTQHMLIGCIYAQGFWRMLIFRFNLQIAMWRHEGIVQLWWDSRSTMMQPVTRLWDTVWVSRCWAL